MKFIRGLVHATTSDFGPTYFSIGTGLNIGNYGLDHTTLEKS